MAATGAIAPIEPVGSAGAGGVELVLEAETPDQQAHAESLRRVDPGTFDGALALVGLTRGGDPVRVLLVGEASELARTTPPQIHGFAYSALGTVVLLTGRTPGYPDSSMVELLVHEVTHVLISRAAGHRDVPRWFHEGLAVVAASPWGLSDRSWLTWSMLVDRETSLADLGRRFTGSPREVRGAYAVSAALVRDLVGRHGPGVTAEILDELRRGATFDRAFESATGARLEAYTRSFWRRHDIWYRWVPLVTSSFFLWMLITALALVAISRRRVLDARLRARWAEEEALERSREEAALPPGDHFVN